MNLRPFAIAAVTAAFTLAWPSGADAPQTFAGCPVSGLRYPEVFHAEGKQEYLLAPDSSERKGNVITQVWTLEGQHPAFVRCQYAGSPARVVPVPGQAKACRLRYTANSRGEVVQVRELKCE
jgi:hypothetical protein